MTWKAVSTSHHGPTSIGIMGVFPLLVTQESETLPSFLFRMASKANANIDDPGAFPAREWLRNLCVGKQVAFETR